MLTRSLLALVMLNGISLVFWGCVGVCRWLHERARRVGHGPTSAALLALLGALLGAFMLVLALEVIVWVSSSLLDRLGLAPAAAASALIVLVLAGLLVCGAVASRVSTRLFEAPTATAAVVLSAVVYWLAAATLVHDAVAAALVTPLSDALSWAVLALSGVACALGVLLGHRRVSPAAPGAQPPLVALVAPVAGVAPTADHVAVLIAAHNEERTLEACLDAVSKCVPAGSVYLASDGSTDRTVEIATARGCNVLDIQPNGGKARALAAAIERFGIRERYAAVLILDADAQPAPDYLEHALPLLRDPEVAAVAGHALTHWHRHVCPRASMFFVAYRTRLYRLTQALLRYGQTWKHSNVSFIVPGFASMYRCSVLPHIDIDAPGLIIEDFNMTFELHHKRLGRIAYSPRVRCISHEPVSLRDYVKQVRRWYLGFWQTIRRHGFWPGVFWLSLGAFVVEMLLQSLAFLSVPLLLAWFVISPAESITIWLPQLGAAELTWTDVAIGVFLTDYATTALVAVIERKPILLCYGLGFALLRWVDAFLFLYTLPLAFAVESDGRWESPKRA